MRYYLAVGSKSKSRAHRLHNSDCGHIEAAEHLAVEVFKQLRARGKDRIVRVVDARTRIVEFAVHQGNIGNLE